MILGCKVGSLYILYFADFHSNLFPEGFDFIEKVKMDTKEFTQIRRDVKGIVKAKVKNSERKNKMFKKKLGGSRKRKHIRMKKALKR